MSIHLVLLASVLGILCGFSSGERRVPPQREFPGGLEHYWPEGGPNILDSVSNYHGPCTVVLTSTPSSRRVIRVQLICGGEEIYSWDTFPQGQFLIHNEVLYHTSFHPRVTGMAVVAHDLETNEPRWNADLIGLAVQFHYQYGNGGATIQRRGDSLIVVSGRESAGEYVEVLSMRTGETLANQPRPNVFEDAGSGYLATLNAYLETTFPACSQISVVSISGVAGIHFGLTLIEMRGTFSSWRNTIQEIAEPYPDRGTVYESWRERAERLPWRRVPTEVWVTFNKAMIKAWPTKLRCLFLDGSLEGITAEVSTNADEPIPERNEALLEFLSNGYGRPFRLEGGSPDSHRYAWEDTDGNRASLQFTTTQRAAVLSYGSSRLLNHYRSLAASQ